MSYLPPSHPPPTYSTAISTPPKHPEPRHDSFDYNPHHERHQPMTPAQQADEEAAAQAAFLEASLASIPKPLHRPSPYPRLPRIIAIPQIAIGSSARPPNPLTRAYAPLLSAYDIPPSAFLQMLDTINVCLGPSPPFQVLQVASMGIGFVPHEWAMGVSAGLGVLAGAGTAATCYFRTKQCLEKMREEVWKPRGLRCMMVKDGEVLEALGISEEEAWRLMPARRRGEHVELARRRLEALRPFVAPLDFDVPAPAERRNVLDKLGAKQQARKVSKKERENEKKAVKREKTLHKTARKYNRTSEELEGLDATWDSNNSSIDSDVESILSLEDEMRKLDVKNAKKEKKAEGKLSGASSEKKHKEYEKKSGERRKEYEKERGKLERKLERRTKKGNKRERKQDKREDKERKKVGSLRWIIIRNWDWEAEGSDPSS
ncbi:hypothetical protein BU16DRAFT_585220 [Lophium mytilinum]|uniref:Uncharacterized protein n=1 Tax=Lophium mytilinum TaxID=390894 RepID=A0A6A6QHE2_9PEZI|nr:hypothetical protein BU16DRAFT_585220 [Lophium mytilinum]